MSMVSSCISRGNTAAGCDADKILSSDCSSLSSRILSSTSKFGNTPAVLMLEDGTAFYGRSCGVSGEAFGEICFNTSLEGYLEVITDPSYAGQIVTMTYPQIGNYGVSLADAESAAPALRGLVVHDMCATPSNWRSDMSLPDYLSQHGIVAIEGIDTRALVRHIRETGAQKAVLSTEDLDAASLSVKLSASEGLVGENLVETVSCAEPYTLNSVNDAYTFARISALERKFDVVVYDCGVKDSILQGLVRAGCALTVVPWDTPAEQVLDMHPDGVFLSNGPGDPDAVRETFLNAEKLLGEVPMFGICLGHQMLSLASGARMEKLKYGHRGGNHPVMNLLTRRVEITAQNHGFGLVFPSLGDVVAEESGGYSGHADDLRVWADRGVAPVVMNARFGRIRLTHINLNDGTCEGIQFLDVPAFSVQYHPEANPGPTDSSYLFTSFAELMSGKPDYLDIDISEDRLSGWNFSNPDQGIGRISDESVFESVSLDEKGCCHA